MNSLPQTTEQTAQDMDAKRYRWLKANGLFAQPQGYDTQIGIAASGEPEGVLFISNVCTRNISAAIDAAIAKENER